MEEHYSKVNRNPTLEGKIVGMETEPYSTKKIMRNARKRIEMGENDRDEGKYLEMEENFSK